MAERFRDTPTWPARWPALVRCPRCDGCARADAVPGTLGGAKLTCAACGLAKSGRTGGPAYGLLRLQTAGEGPKWRNAETREITTWPPATDEVHELWLRAYCCGGQLLWATNEDHLGYLERFVGAELRERSAPGARGRTWAGLAWKLPAWMKEAKHRDEVLHELAKLRSTLPSSS